MKIASAVDPLAIFATAEAGVNVAEVIFVDGIPLTAAPMVADVKLDEPL